MTEKYEHCSVVTACLVPVSSEVTKEGKSDANDVEDDTSNAGDVQAKVGTSDAHEEVLPSALQSTQPKETDSRCYNSDNRLECHWVISC